MVDKYEDYKYALRHHICEVTFEKANGEERIMTCTLQDDFIPQDMKPKGTGKAKTHDTVSAYDIKAQGWRSFRIASVKNFEVKDN